MYYLLTAPARGGLDLSLIHIYDMVRNLNCVSLNSGVALKRRNYGLQNGHHNIQKGLTCALLFVESVGCVSSVVVAGDGDHSRPVVMIKADGVLVSALLHLLVDIQLAAEVEGKGERIADNVLAYRLEVAERPLLEGAQRRVANLNRGHNLRRDKPRADEQHRQECNSTCAHKPSLLADRVDQPLREYTRSGPGRRLRSACFRRAASARSD